MPIEIRNMRAKINLQRARSASCQRRSATTPASIFPTESIRTGRKLVEIIDLQLPRESPSTNSYRSERNDRYWPLDALKLYWNGLQEPKRVLYVPNQGHSLRDADRLIGSIGALHRYSARDQPLPQV